MGKENKNFPNPTVLCSLFGLGAVGTLVRALGWGLGADWSPRELVSSPQSFGLSMTLGTLGQLVFVSPPCPSGLGKETANRPQACQR